MAVEVRISGTLYRDVAAGFAALATDLEAGFDKAVVRVSPLLLQSLEKVSAELVKMHGNGWNGRVVNPSDKLQRRSGSGLRSIADSIKVAAANGNLIAVGEISGGTLSFHEEGGTIRATRAQYLTIPLPAALDPRGVPLRRRARDWDNTFVKRSRRGNLIIFRKLPSARELTPLYILKSSVYIKPRLRMEPTLMTEMSYFESKLLEEMSDIIDANL
jgi:hypothetical protein